MKLWEILVPTVHRKSKKPIKTRFHRVWDAKVRGIAFGLTILTPAKGQWVAQQGEHEGETFNERMIPVRIACTEEQIKQIADITLAYYDQLAVLYYLVSDDVRMIHKGA